MVTEINNYGVVYRSRHYGGRSTINRARSRSVEVYAVPNIPSPSGGKGAICKRYTVRYYGSALARCGNFYNGHVQVFPSPYYIRHPRSVRSAERVCVYGGVYETLAQIRHV